MDPIINYGAVFVAAMVSMVVGGLWFSPVLFGKTWMKLSGITPKKIAEAKKKGMNGMALSYFGQFIASLVTAYVLAHFVDYANATTFVLGLQTGFWVWLGFVAPIMLGMVLWEGKPMQLYILNVGHYLVCLLLMGGILAAWA